MATITRAAPRDATFTYGIELTFGSLLMDPGAHVRGVTTNLQRVNGVDIVIAGGIDIFTWTGSTIWVDIAPSGFISTTFLLTAEATGSNTVFNDGYIHGGMFLTKFLTTPSEINSVQPDFLVNSGTIAISRSGDASVDVVLGTITNLGLITHSGWNSGSLAIKFGDIPGDQIVDGNNTVNNSGTIMGGLHFEGGSDLVDNQGTIRGAINMGAGIDQIYNSGTIYGAISMGAGHDFVDNTFGRITSTIDLGDGFDQYFGGSYVESVVGGAGDDTIDLGAGNDFYFATNNDGDDVLEGGIGSDTYSLSALTAAVTFDLGEPEGASFGFDTVTGFENVVGTGFVDVLIGTNSANQFTGGAGGDQMTGLGGNDVYYVDNGTDRVIEVAGGGTDRVMTSTSYQMTVGSDIELLSTAFPTSISNFNLSGNALANTIEGNAGMNIINGMGGNDILRGKGGNDSYFVDSAGDRVFESADSGTDRVLASTSYVLTAGSSIESLTTNSSTATTAINLTGNELGNGISGNAGANVITGGLGGDSMNGALGNDRYDFNSVAESTVTSRDSITWENGDLIDVSTIDANPLVAGDQAFAFIGSATFTAPGQLRVYTVSGIPRTIVDINVTGSSAPEMEFFVTPGTGFGSTAFIL